MRIPLLLILICCLALPAYSQDYKKEEAKAFFLNEHFEDALAVLKSADAQLRNDLEAQFIQAVCLYQVNQLQEAEAVLQRLARQEGAYPECWLYLGKVSHAMNRFERAASYYKDYLRRLRPNHPNRSMVWDEIRRCATGMRVQYQRSDAYAENLGPGVNSAADEYAPIVSPNHAGRLYFSARRKGNMGGLRNEYGMPDTRFGQYYADIYTCTAAAAGANWQNARSMGYLLNSTQHDMLLGFNPEGQVMYFYQGWRPGNGQILVDTFRNAAERTVSADVFEGPVSPAMGDEAPFFVNDTLIYFSSRRKGGFGGLDIYRTVWRDGSWSEPENLGEQINTPYDETTPFLARDQRTLYYSTNHPNFSVGGLDVVKSVYNQYAMLWTVPENLGSQINSAGDDAYFRVSNDGFTAYFSSSRKDGMGKRDIYAAHFKTFLPEMELPVPQLTAGKPMASRVQPSVLEQEGELAAQPAAEEMPVALPDIAVPQSGEEPEEPILPVAMGQPEAGDSAAVGLPAGAAVEEVWLTPFLGGNAAVGFTAEEKLQLDWMAEVMTASTDPYLVITAYVEAPSAIAGVQVYEAVRRAESAAQHLIDKGVGSGQVFVRGTLAEKGALPDGARTAIDFHFYEPLSSGGSAGDMAVVAKLAVEGHAINAPLLFKVQVASLSGAYKSSRLNGLPVVMVERQMDSPYYRYTVGGFDSHSKADAYRAKLLSGDFSSAYVTAYVNGRRADQRLAEKHLSEFADLKHYIR